MKITIKTGVEPPILIILAAFTNSVSKLDLSLVNVTSGIDGKHKSKSKHYQLCALDFSSKIYLKDKLDDLIDDLKSRLGPDYDVILEDFNGPNEHIHVEFDPK